MKRITSIILTAMILAVITTVLAVHGAAEAENLGSLKVGKSEYRTLDSGEYVAADLTVGVNAAKTGSLTIPEGTTLTVTGDFNNHGTITVYGTLILEDETPRNTGVICASCPGKIIYKGKFYGNGTVTNDGHTFQDGVCTVCGANEIVGSGSMLSEGSLTIICTVAAAAVFGLGGFFIGRGKKKKSAADES